MSKPTYIQIFESLAEEIENGHYTPGDKLPSERDLSESLGVSRMTVRQAVEALARQGFVYRKQGSGTYVSEVKIEHHVNFLEGFYDTISKKGLMPGAVLLSSEQIPASKKIANLLELDVGRSLYYIHRLRTANEEPIALEHSYFSAERFPDLEQYNLVEQSLYGILREEYGIQLKYAEQTFEPVIANNYESEILSIELGAPLMLVRRIAFDKDDHPVEYAKDIYRGDRSRFAARSDLSVPAE